MYDMYVYICTIHICLLHIFSKFCVTFAELSSATNVKLQCIFVLNVYIANCTFARFKWSLYLQDSDPVRLLYITCAIYKNTLITKTHPSKNQYGLLSLVTSRSLVKLSFLYTISLLIRDKTYRLKRLQQQQWHTFKPSTTPWLCIQYHDYSIHKVYSFSIYVPCDL
jgi:hypothetical protein